MIFSDVLEDLKKLIGLELKSIRPGANIFITGIDINRGSLTLRTSSGKNRSRPIEELERIWDQMMLSPAIHVEGVLSGSGTSRNQPETILANLPYVEWLKINNKKHIAYVGENTHPYGTLKQMDPVKTVEIIAQMETGKDNTQFKTIIVTKDVNQSLSVIKNVLQGTVSTIDKGIYQFKADSNVILFLSSDNCELKEGTYSVVGSKSCSISSDLQKIGGEYYSVVDQGEIKMLIKRDKNQ